MEIYLLHQQVEPCPIIILRISVSVSRIPSAAIRPMLAMVCSTLSFTRPSPAPKVFPSIDISCARMAASTDAAILAAQLPLAPSQTIPETLASVLVMVRPMVS